VREQVKIIWSHVRTVARIRKRKNVPNNVKTVFTLWWYISLALNSRGGCLKYKVGFRAVC
jgi:hypothetical protein